MADGLTPKQEAFSQVYVETNNASEAYRRVADVGEDTKPESIWQAASRMLANVKVSSRVMELQQAHAERHDVTIDSLTEELNEARAQAQLDPKGANAHVAAVMGKAKLHGLITDKKELGGKDGGPVQVLISGKDADLL